MVGVCLVSLLLPLHFQYCFRHIISEQHLSISLFPQCRNFYFNFFILLLLLVCIYSYLPILHFLHEFFPFNSFLPSIGFLIPFPLYCFRSSTFVLSVTIHNLMTVQFLTCILDKFQNDLQPLPENKSLSTIRPNTAFTYYFDSTFLPIPFVPSFNH